MEAPSDGKRTGRQKARRRDSRATSTRGGSPPRGTRPEDTKGGELERRVARLEFAEGAFVRLRVKVAADDAESGRDILTDIDVISLDVDSRLRLSRSALECKSAKGQAGEPFTLVWLAGFRQLLALDRAVLVRQTMTRRGRALAARLGISVIDESLIRVREQAHAWLPERFAHLDGPACLAAESRTDIQLKGLPEISGGLGTFLRNDALLATPAALLAAVSQFGEAAHRHGVLPEPTATVMSGHSLIAVILAAVQDAGHLDVIPAGELTERLNRALTLGDPDDTYLLPLLERADALIRYFEQRTHRAYVEAGADPIRVDVPSLRDLLATPPEYILDYVDLVERFRANPQVARDLLQTAELISFDALLGDNAWKSPAFARLFTTEHKGLLIAALNCLGRIAGPQIRDSIGRIAEAEFVGSSGRVPDRRVPADGQTPTSTGEAHTDSEALAESARGTAPGPADGGDSDELPDDRDDEPHPPLEGL